MNTARIRPRPVALFIIAASLLFAKLSICQISSGEGKPIVVNEKGDLFIVGEVWSPTDPSEKPIEGPGRILCRKRLGACAAGPGHLLTVVSWTSKRVVLTEDEPDGEPCWKPRVYVVDLSVGSVSQLTAPGRHPDLVDCKWGTVGRPRRIVYHLSHFAPIDRPHATGSTLAASGLADSYPHHEVYEVQGGVQMAAKFAPNGLVCEMRLEQAHFGKDSVDMRDGIGEWRINGLIDELVPRTERGEEDKADPSNGMILGTGQVMENVHSYSNIRVHVLSSHGTTVAYFHWRHRQCSP